MNKFSISIFSFLSLFLPAQTAECQDTTGLCPVIAEKFREYCKALPREEIFIHTDRTDYIAGELLWFSIYLIDRQSNKPSQNSSIVYVELLNSQNWPVVQKRLGIGEGAGPGQFSLSDTLSSGKYTLRAYTSWMKNFLPDNCFTRELYIYNAFKQQPVSRTSNKTIAVSNISENIHSSSHSGQGLSLRVNNLEPDSLIIIINRDDTLLSGNVRNCYLAIQTHGRINLVRNIGLQASYTRLALNKRILIPGINQLTIFNSGGQPVAERYIYTPASENKFLLLNSPDRVNPRDNITIKVSPVHGDNTFRINNLSISAAVETESGSLPDMADYMVFGTEFGILPDEIRNHKLNSLAPEVIDNFLQTVKSSWIDWNAVVTGNFTPLRFKAEKDDHFLKGTLLKKNSDELEANKCLFLSISDKTPDFQYARTDSDGSFIFHIPADRKIRNLIIQPEDTDLNSIIRIESPFAEEYSTDLRLQDSLAEPIPEYVSEMSINYQVRKIYKLPGDTESSIPEVTGPKPKRFYGKPDIELVMADYIKLSSMQEVFSELMPGIFLRNRKSRYSLSIFDPVGKSVYKKPPVLFIDGVVVNDPAVLAGIDPGLVEKIDAVTNLYVVGDYCFFGIINIITAAGDFSSVSLPPNAVRLSYRPVEQVRSFLLPDHSTDGMRQSRIPDFRNTLYWNPEVKPDKEGIVMVDFPASDKTGKYEIRLHGISAEGNMIDIRKTIIVK